VVFLDETGKPTRHTSINFDHSYAYLSVDRSGKFLLGCDYGSGAVDVYLLGKDRVPGTRVTGLDEGRSKAHCILPSPDNRFVYIPYVKSGNALYQYAFDATTGTLTALDPKNANPPADTGPRHMAYHPTLPVLYFTEEQGLGISLYRQAKDGRLTFWQRTRALKGDAPSKRVSSSDILLTPNGRYLYAGIRGHIDEFDYIAGYQVLKDGSLKSLGLTPADKIPWGLAASPDGRHLIATGYRSATLMVFTIGRDGNLTRSATMDWDKYISDVVTR
jgi:6-phosphogluconolactonase